MQAQPTEFPRPPNHGPYEDRETRALLTANRRAPADRNILCRPFTMDHHNQTTAFAYSLRLTARTAPAEFAAAV